MPVATSLREKGVRGEGGGDSREKGVRGMGVEGFEGMLRRVYWKGVYRKVTG
jgi:hypothetical protein